MPGRRYPRAPDSSRAMDASTERRPPQTAIGEITRRYYLVWWFYAFGGGFVFGVYPLFLRSRGLTQLQANSVLATYFMITFLTDVPTGAFADAISRRTGFMLCCTLRTASFTLYFFSHRYLLFLLAESIDAIGTTFGNGAIDAWAVDALDAAGFSGVKDRIFSRISQLTNTGWLLSAMIGAYVADVRIAWPWLLGAGGYLASLFVGAILMRGERAPVQPELRRLASDIAGRIRAGLREGFHSRPVLLLTLASAIQVGSWAPYWMQWPQYFHLNLGFGIWVIGWLYCFFSIGRLLGAEFIARLGPGEASRSPLLAGLSLASGGLLVAAARAGRPYVTLMMLFVMNACSGAMAPVVQSWINEHLEAHNRATLLSFQSTFATLGGSIGLLLCGWIADRYGFLTAWIVAGLIGLWSAVFYWMLRAEKLPAQAIPQPATANIAE